MDIKSMFAPGTGPIELGFLSPDMSKNIEECRKQNAIWFKLAEDINRSCQKILGEFQIGPGEVIATQLFGILFLIRTLSNFQGSILMAERGMVIEARTLARCCYENLFCVATLLKDGDKFLSEMDNGAKVAQKSTARWILQEPKRLDFSGPGAAAKLKAHVEEMDRRWGKLTALEWRNLAERGGVGDAYLYYKLLSGDGAHPSLASLNHYISSGPGDAFKGVKWGPDIGGAADSLNIVCNAAVMIGLGVAQIVNNDGLQRELTDHARAYAQLNGIQV
jgi:Family of unknown function (DUF5677)